MTTRVVVTRDPNPPLGFFQRRPALAFFLFAVPLHVVLVLVPWPGLQDAYGRYYRAYLTLIFHHVGRDGYVRIGSLREPGMLGAGVKMPAPKPGHDTVVVAGARSAPGTYGVRQTSSRLVGYYPTAFTAVLVLATPLGWRRRVVAFLGGMILVHLFIALRVWVWLLSMFCGDKEYCQYHPGERWMKALDDAAQMLHFNPTASFTFAVLIWMLVLYWSGALRRFFQQATA